MQFNHVEVICEGYDYPEDDYILLGSCGLEFTLDYKDPHDSHDFSYFKHMDEHEKQMHHDKVRAKTPKPESSYRLFGNPKWLLNQLLINIENHIILIAIIFMILVLLYVLLVRIFPSNNQDKKSTKGKQVLQRASSYGPLTAAVLTTKKAC